MRSLLIILLFIIIYFNVNLCYADEVDCSKHKIYCHIVQINPNINKTYAMELSNTIYKVSKKYNINERIYTAILAQESMFTLKAKNCTKGVIFENKIVGKERRVCSDFGISQINYKTANSFDLELPKLLLDLEYSVEAGAIILADFKKRYESKEQDYWTRYNASSRDKREIYKRLVERYL